MREAIPVLALLWSCSLAQASQRKAHKSGTNFEAACFSPVVYRIQAKFRQRLCSVSTGLMLRSGPQGRVATQEAAPPFETPAIARR